MNMPSNLSPSENHQYLLKNIKPQLAFQGGDIDLWRDNLKAKLKELLGIPQISRPAIEPQRLSVKQHELGVIEKIQFQSEIGADILAYFCVPHAIKPPYPVVICLQGHSTGMHVSIASQFDDETQSLITEGDRDFALGCMRNGFAALCIEQRSFGWRSENSQPNRSANSCHDAAMQALMLGRTLVGERVYDVDRGLDYLQARGDIDMSRVGVLGTSGGGTTAVYSAALLDRVQFAVPSCCFCTYSDSIMSIHHCACNYVPGILQWARHADVLGLFAPKPVVVVAGKEDDIFPIEGVRKAVSDLQQIYEAVGNLDNCVLVEGDGGHRFYERDAWPKLRELLDK
jgi:dienelactone hydrolase